MDLQASLHQRSVPDDADMKLWSVSGFIGATVPTNQDEDGITHRIDEGFRNTHCPISLPLYSVST